MPGSDLIGTGLTDARRAQRLHRVLDELAAAIDAARDGDGASERDSTRAQIAVTRLEQQVVALVRPRRWRLRDLRTGGVRHLEAAGVVLDAGTLTYGGRSWPARFSTIAIGPHEADGARVLSITRSVRHGSTPPFTVRREGRSWTARAGGSDQAAALCLAAVVNTAARQRRITGF